MFETGVCPLGSALATAQIPPFRFLFLALPLNPSYHPQFRRLHLAFAPALHPRLFAMLLPGVRLARLAASGCLAVAAAPATPLGVPSYSDLP